MFGILALVEHIVFAVVVIIVVNIWKSEGWSGLARSVIQLLRQIPAVDGLVRGVLQGEVKKFTQKVKDSDKDDSYEKQGPKVPIPEKGIPAKELMDEMAKLKAADVNPADGQIFAYVYTLENDTFELQRKAYDMFCEKTGLGPDHDKLVQEFHHAFMHENALNPMVFPTLRKFENEVVSMTAWMLHGDEDVVGSMTSGGTESILMAMKTCRDYARKHWPHITEPQMVAPITIHPAHEKAAHYFGFTIKHVPVGKDFKPDMVMYEKAVNSNTIALLCSAPNYSQGVIDPIKEIATLGLQRGLPVHVDACFGGFMLPWVEKLGHPIEPFDFRVPGVTSISADIHKYGFGAKGASVILYKNEHYRKHQIFAYSGWPGGLFGSPSMAGTRPGGNIAAAWVTLKSIGQDGYMKIAQQLMDVTQNLKGGINSIEGLCILGNPSMTAFSIGASGPAVSILAVADVLEDMGWKPERQQFPDSLHCSITPNHARITDKLLADLKTAADKVKGKGNKTESGSAAMYGMLAQIPDKGIIDDFIVEFFSEVYKL